jgi:hypothetical protein
MVPTQALLKVPGSTEKSHQGQGDGGKKIFFIVNSSLKVNVIM